MNNKHERLVRLLIVDLLIILVGILGIGIRGAENWQTYEYIFHAFLLAIIIHSHHSIRNKKKENARQGL